MPPIGTTIGLGKMGFKLSPAQEKAMEAREKTKAKLNPAQEKAKEAREKAKAKKAPKAEASKSYWSKETDVGLRELYEHALNDYTNEDLGDMKEDYLRIIEGLKEELKKRGLPIPTSAPKKEEVKQPMFRGKPLSNGWTTPYIYKIDGQRQDVAPWLSVAIVVLKKAVRYSELSKDEIKPKHIDNIGMGLVDVSLKSGMFSGINLDVWKNDLQVDWDWEEKEKDIWHPIRVQGARVGFAWKPTDDPTNEENNKFENIVRVYMEIDEKGNETFKCHVRTENERSDDEIVDDYVEKRLAQFDKSYINHLYKYYKAI